MRPIRSACLVLAFALTACGPAPSTKSAGKPAAKPGRKCPDLDVRDSKDPCSPMYLNPPTKAPKRDSL